MTWGAVGGAAVSVIGGSLLGGGSKGAERAAKDAAARAQLSQDAARRTAMESLAPYTDSGRNATQKLSELLGIADPEGYGKRPELQDYENLIRDAHFRWSGGEDYDRNSNVASEARKAKDLYNEALAKWEAGKEEYIRNNPGTQGDGALLKSFTNEDFEKDPGYEFRQQEGEKGINRALASRGSFDSGAALKALNRYNQDYASNEFGNAFNRDSANKSRTFSFLSGASGQGLQAAGAGVGVGQNAANNNSQIQQNLGSNLANMYQTNADNKSNLFQSAIGNAIYAYGRNAPVTGSIDGSSWFSGSASKGNPLNWWEMT